MQVYCLISRCFNSSVINKKTSKKEKEKLGWGKEKEERKAYGKEERREDDR